MPQEPLTIKKLHIKRFAEALRRMIISRFNELNAEGTKALTFTVLVMGHTAKDGEGELVFTKG